MRKQVMIGCLFASLTLMLGAVAPALAQNYWTGLGADNLWSNPDNWYYGIPLAGEDVFVDGPPYATPPHFPLIEDGIDAQAGVLIGEKGVTSMTMTGGTLTLDGWGMWWGDSGDVNATFNMSGGVINFIGSPGVFEMAWQDDADPPGGAHSVWNMTGGVVNALGMSFPASGELDCTATIHLDGGTFNVGTSRDGMKMKVGGLVDITEGTIVLEGEQPQVTEYIANGWIVAYGGNGTLVDEFDGTYRTLSALPGYEGDFDEDGDVDGDDFLAWQVGFPKESDAVKGDGDYDNDGDVDGDDFLGWQTEYPSPGAGAGSGAVPEPATFGLLILAGLAVASARKRLT